MTEWQKRPSEERALLNPAFCSALMWKASTGYACAADSVLPFDLAFLVLPIVLHRATRESLPTKSTSSLPAWLHDHPLSRPVIADRARLLRPFTKEALLFGGSHGLLHIDGKGVAARDGWAKRITSQLKELSEEVRDCAKRAEFVGKWFAKAGTSSTVMAIVGVKP